MTAPTRVGRFEWERAFRQADLPLSVKAVGVWSATYANQHGGQVHPGVERLQEATGATKRTVLAGLATLRDLGWLVRVRQGSDCGRKALADDYVLTLPVGVELPEQGAETTPDREEQGAETHPDPQEQGAETTRNRVQNSTPTTTGTTTGEGSTEPRNPRLCSEHSHLSQNPNPCGACGDARKAYDQAQAAAKATERAEQAARPDCPLHRGQKAHACSMCRADQLAGEFLPGERCATHLGVATTDGPCYLCQPERHLRVV